MKDNSWKSELLKAAIMAAVVAYEWWVMQPYHEPLTAKIWLWVSRFSYWVARNFGTLGLAAEHEYYMAVA